MSNKQIIKIQTRAPEETAALANAFGAIYLKSLLDSGIPELQSLVVMVYGSIGSGKTAFIKGAIQGTLPTLANWEFINYPRVVSEKESSDKLFRRIDFGPSFTEEGHPIIPLRQKLDTPGVDFYEHPPLLYLDSAGAVINIVNHFNYFEYGSAHLLTQALSRTKRQLTQHQQKAKKLTLKSYANIKDRTNTRTAPTLAQLQSRVVHIMPTTDHPVALEAFRNFEKHAIKEGFKLAA